MHLVDLVPVSVEYIASSSTPASPIHTATHHGTISRVCGLQSHVLLDRNGKEAWTRYGLNLHTTIRETRDG